MVRMLYHSMGTNTIPLQFSFVFHYTLNDTERGEGGFGSTGVGDGVAVAGHAQQPVRGRCTGQQCGNFDSSPQCDLRLQRMSYARMAIQ